MRALLAVVIACLLPLVTTADEKKKDEKKKPDRPRQLPALHAGEMKTGDVGRLATPGWAVQLKVVQVVDKKTMVVRPYYGPMFAVIGAPRATLGLPLIISEVSTQDVVTDKIVSLEQAFKVTGTRRHIYPSGETATLFVVRPATQEETPAEFRPPTPEELAKKTAEAKQRAEEEAKAKTEAQAKAEADAKAKATADRELAAANKLKAAKRFVEDGRPADAIDFLDELLKKYPTSKAAGEAKELRAKLAAKK